MSVNAWKDEVIAGLVHLGVYVEEHETNSNKAVHDLIDAEIEAASKRQAFRAMEPFEDKDMAVLRRALLKFAQLPSTPVADSQRAHRMWTVLRQERIFPVKR